MEKEPKYRVPAVDKALDIIEFLSTQTEPVTLGYLAKMTDRSTNEIFRVVDRLIVRGYIIKHEGSGALNLSMRTWTIANNISSIQMRIRHAAPSMAALATSTGLSCHLNVLEERMVHIIHEESPPDPIAVRVNVGASFPASNTSSGRCLLTLAERYSPPHNPPTDSPPAATDHRESGIEYLQLVERRGSFHPDIVDLIVVIGEQGTVPLAALVVPFIASQHHSVSAEIHDEVLQAAHTIAANYGVTVRRDT